MFPACQNRALGTGHGAARPPPTEAASGSVYNLAIPGKTNRRLGTATGKEPASLLFAHFPWMRKESRTQAAGKLRPEKWVKRLPPSPRFQNGQLTRVGRGRGSFAPHMQCRIFHMLLLWNESLQGGCSFLHPTSGPLLI